MEDFQVWRNDEANGKLVNRGIIAVLCLVILWVLIRLWFAKNKSAENKSGGVDVPPWKMIKKFDKWCSKQVGNRPVGMPYGKWIAQLPQKFPDKSEDVNLLVDFYRSERFSTTTSHGLEKLKLLIARVMAKN